MTNSKRERIAKAREIERDMARKIRITKNEACMSKMSAKNKSLARELTKIVPLDCFLMGKN